MTQNTNDNGILSVSNLSYAYPGSESPAIADIDFSLSRGTIFGLLGPSGAGKSTVQRILTRQIRRIDKGSVSLFGKDIEQWDHHLYERIGVGFELPNHYPKLTGLENLNLFASFYTRATQNPLELLKLVGLEASANQRVSAYSKGMQVRLNFARAIVHDPELLFLDEPTSGLDPTTAAHLRSVIAELRARGKAIVLTTHNMHDVEALCDQIGFIAGGRLVAVGEPQSLKLKHGERQVDAVVDIDGAPIKRRFSLDKLWQNTDFLDFIRDRHIHTLHSQEASLDKVFQVVTGETLTSQA